MPAPTSPDRRTPSRRSSLNRNLTVTKAPVASAKVESVVLPDGSGDPATFVVEIRGQLDAAAGQELLTEVQRAIEQRPARVQIDLHALEEFTPEGIKALAACRAYMGRFPGGLHVRTMGDVARRAYLTAFA
jgi:anti-anti-sigma regulatory factor